MSKYLGDICVKSGSYTDQDGKEKGRYEKVGTMFENEESGNVSILLTMVPLCNFGKDGGVWLSFFPAKPKEGNGQQPQKPAAPPQKKGWGQR